MMRLMKNVADTGEMRNKYKISVWKPKMSSSFMRLRHKFKKKTEICHKAKFVSVQTIFVLTQAKFPSQYAERIQLTFRFHERQRIYGLDERRLASELELCAIEWAMLSRSYSWVCFFGRIIKWPFKKVGWS
jgi:hypothetical protein